jgi:hypothetical protein
MTRPNPRLGHIGPVALQMSADLGVSTGIDSNRAPGPMMTVPQHLARLAQVAQAGLLDVYRDGQTLGEPTGSMAWQLAIVSEL